MSRRGGKRRKVLWQWGFDRKCGILPSSMDPEKSRKIPVNRINYLEQLFQLSSRTIFTSRRVFRLPQVRKADDSPGQLENRISSAKIPENIRNGEIF